MNIYSDFTQEMTYNQILQGDVLEVLKTLPDRSVNCVMTSPPYYGLRDYGTGEWKGGDSECDHKPGSQARANGSTLSGGHNHGGHLLEGFKGQCAKCGATRIDKQIGLEETPEEYIAKLVEVFREVKRVLRDDGNCWLNLGDSYASTGRSNQKASPKGVEGQNKLAPGRNIVWGKDRHSNFSWTLPGGQKPKDLLGIPWRVALALQADGWYLRSDIIWHKRNCLPESVRDRPTKSHEYIFLLSKSARYWYDADAIRETSSDKTIDGHPPPDKAARAGITTNGTGKSTLRGKTLGRNARTVWTIATAPYKGAHFAVFPPALVEKCILAGCPSRVCVECGTPWVRVVEKGLTDGFAPTCQCNGRFEERVIEDYYDWEEGEKDREKVVRVYVPHIPLNEHPRRPGVVLDPFFGSGTTGVVAGKLGRQWLGIEFNPDYVEMANDRLNKTQPALPGIFC